MADSNMTDVIFVGNPGTGKSTILSCISNLEFESGLSFGGGLTAELKFQPASPSSPIRYGDTPGLADVSIQDQAANAIEGALKKSSEAGRKVILIFVVTVEAGRVRPSDLLTIKAVMSSFKLPNDQKPGNNSYGIIINKFPEAALKNPNFFKPGGNREKVEKPFRLTDGADDRITTNVIGYNAFSIDLHDKDNARGNENISKTLKTFIFDVCPKLTIGTVKKVEVVSEGDMAAQIKELQAQIARAETKAAPPNQQNGFWLKIMESTAKGIGQGPIGEYLEESIAELLEDDELFE